jgi:hypothetical protein
MMTINVPVVYMTRDVKIFMRENTLQGRTPSNGLSYGFARNKMILVPASYKKQLRW